MLVRDAGYGGIGELLGPSGGSAGDRTVQAKPNAKIV